MYIHPILVEITFNLLYLYPVLIIVGSIGNMLAFYIFGCKNFKKTIFSLYLRVLCCVDTFTLVFLATNKFIRLRYEISLRDVDLFWCKFTMWLTYCVSPMSSYLLVVVAIDRLISIWRPTFFVRRKRFRFQVWVCMIVVVYNALFYSPLLLSYIETNYYFDNSTQTEKSWNKCLLIDYDLVRWMDLANSSVIPFSFMIVSSTITIIVINDSRKRLRNHRPALNDKNSSTTMSKKRDIKFAITSVTLNVIFLILNLPFCFYDLLYETFQIDADTQYFFDTFLLMLYYVHHATVFFINLAVNSIFRNEMYNIFGRKGNNNSN